MTYVKIRFILYLNKVFVTHIISADEKNRSVKKGRSTYHVCGQKLFYFVQSKYALIFF